jgi:hypothetical protein
LDEWNKKRNHGIRIWILGMLGMLQFIPKNGGKAGLPSGVM